MVCWPRGRGRGRGVFSVTWIDDFRSTDGSRTDPAARAAVELCRGAWGESVAWCARVLSDDVPAGAAVVTRPGLLHVPAFSFAVTGRKGVFYRRGLHQTTSDARIVRFQG